MYLEAVAMLPQIYMFQRQASDQGGIVEVRGMYMEGDRDRYQDQIMRIMIACSLQSHCSARGYYLYK